MGALPPSRSGWNRALSNMAWSVCRDGHPRPLWAAVPGPHHPPSEEFPLTVPLASTFLRSKPLPLVPSPSDHGKSVSTRTRNAGCAVDPQTFTRLSAVTPRHKRGAKGLREAMLAPCWCKHPADASTLLMQAAGPTLCAAHRSCCPLVWVPRPQPCEVVAVMSQWCQGAAIVTRGAGSRAKAAGLGPCSVRPGEAWREQRLSCFSPSMPNMSGRKKEAPKSGKPGGSTVSLHVAPCCQAQGCLGSACGWEERKGRAGAPQCCGQAGPFCSLGRGHSFGYGCSLGLLDLRCPLPLHPLQPYPSADTAGLEQAPGTAPRDTRPCQVLTAAHGCSLLPLQCACCAAGHGSTRTSAGRHLPMVGSVPTASAW